MVSPFGTGVKGVWMMKNLFGLKYWSFFIRNRQVRLNAVYLLLMMVVSIVLGFLLNWVVGIVMLVVTVTGTALSLRRLQYVVADTHRYLNELDFQVHRGQQEALLEMQIGMVMLDVNQRVEWINPYMAQYLDLQIIVGKKLSEVDSQLAQAVKDHQDDTSSSVINWHDRWFYFLYQPHYRSIYLADVTHFEQMEQRYQQQRVFLGNVYLDNYSELAQRLSDSELSNLHNYVTSTIDTWAKENHVLLKVLDDDNYLIVGHQQGLDAMEKKKFGILDVIRQNTTKQNSPVTLSIGIAYGDDNLVKLADTAQSNLDLALGRGGDQVVVRSKDGTARFYGGKTNPMEKRTRVRARVISQAMQELMAESDQLFVVGHRHPDMDSLGACLGVRRIAEMNGHQCWIVIDQEPVHSDVQRLLHEMQNYQEIAAHVITPAQALDKADDKSLLVMVDHSKPSISIAPDLIDQLHDRLMIIDHHRRGEEFPENPLLVYNEPYASSTCELLAEMFEYQPRESASLNKLEATAMLSGIQVDTKSFTENAGVRTFDAASYLRSAGADSTMIHQFLRENMHSFMERNHLISTLTMINDKMALCTGEDDRIYDSVTAAQAADMLLQMSGVEASFVITRRSEKVVAISARSFGDVNVQVIMEQMGGGGHLGNAATQVKNQSVSQVRQTLVDILKKTTGDDQTDDEGD